MDFAVERVLEITSYGVHFESAMVQSKLTFMIYLNGQQMNFIGGKTLFFNSKLDDTVIQSYEPHQGDVLIFDHNIWHSGELVTNGIKYILRSDIIYENINYKKRIINFNNAHLGYIWGINTFNDKIITYGRDKSIKIWSRNDKYIVSLKGHKNSIISAVQITPKILVSGSRDSTIKIWRNFKLIQTLHKIHNGTILALCKLNNIYFVSAGSDGILNISNCNNGNILTMIRAHNNWIWKVCLMSINDKNETIIITISEDGTLKIWNINILNRKIKKINEWRNEQNIPINCIDINNKKKQLFIGTFNGMIKILKYDINYSLHLIHQFCAHNSIVRCIKIKKSFIYSGGEDNKLYGWNLNINENKYKKVWQYKHNNFVQGILLRNHDDILSVSYDGSIVRHSNITKIIRSKL